MPVIDCPIESCEYVTLDVGEVVAAALITIHTTIHNITASHGAVSQIAKVTRPTLLVWRHYSEEWSYFLSSWTDKVEATKVTSKNRA